MKDLKLLTKEIFTDKDKFGVDREYLYLKYEYEDDEGNTHNRIYPKVKLPIYASLLPRVDEETTTNTLFGSTHEKAYIPVEDGLELCKATVRVHAWDGHHYAEDVYMVDVITKRAVKKMTLSEIEEKLKCKIELVSEKGEEK